MEYSKPQLRAHGSVASLTLHRVGSDLMRRHMHGGMNGMMMMRRRRWWWWWV